MFRKWITEPERIESSVVMSVREWVIVLAVMVIPGVNIVMLFYWSFADKELVSANKVNWARAHLIVLTMAIVAIAIMTLFYFWIDSLRNQ